MTLPFDYGTVDPLATVPRYTNLNIVKGRLGIPLTDTTKDADLTSAIIAAEYAIDAELGRSFPDGPGVVDVSEPGPVQGIPEAVKTVALSVSIAAYKQADAPGGTAGGDFYGPVDIADAVRQTVSRNPELRGFKVGQGFGVA